MEMFCGIRYVHNITRISNDIGPNSFSQYQQRQQEALQGIQTYFEQQRFLVQQQQMLQNLTECYSQMQQQHEDMLHLQQSFSQLFTQPASEEASPTARPSATPNAPASSSRSPNSFSFQPSTSFGYRPQESVRETPPPSPFMSTQVYTFTYQYIPCVSMLFKCYFYETML